MTDNNGPAARALGNSNPLYVPPPVDNLAEHTNEDGDVIVGKN